MPAPSAPVPWWRIDLGDPEIERVAQAIRDRQVSQGRLTEAFERELARILGVPHVVATTSGTVALLVAFLALEIGPGDEVIVPNRTFIATAHAARLLGAGVRLVDVRSDAPLIDPREVEKAIGPRTRAIVPVHLNGRAAPMEDLLRIGRERGIEVVEDACQAFLSRPHGSALGTLSRFGCFSLGMAKLLTTGQGGLVACHTAEDRERLVRLKNQGVFDVATEKDFNLLSGNFKFTDLQAAVGLAQVQRLPGRLERQVAIHRRYREGLSLVRSLRFLPVDVDRGEVPLRAEALVTERDAFLAFLAQEGVSAISQTPSLDRSGHLAQAGEFPNSRLYDDHLVTLPSGPDQPIPAIDRTIETICKVASRLAPW